VRARPAARGPSRRMQGVPGGARRSTEGPGPRRRGAPDTPRLRPVAGSADPHSAGRGRRGRAGVGKSGPTVPRGGRCLPARSRGAGHLADDVSSTRPRHPTTVPARPGAVGTGLERNASGRDPRTGPESWGREEPPGRDRLGGAHGVGVPSSPGAGSGDSGARPETARSGGPGAAGPGGGPPPLRGGPAGPNRHARLGSRGGPLRPVERASPPPSCRDRDAHAWLAGNVGPLIPGRRPPCRDLLSPSSFWPAAS
jgi:hypothetical protein